MRQRERESKREREQERERARERERKREGREQRAGLIGERKKAGGVEHIRVVKLSSVPCSPLSAYGCVLSYLT